MPREPKGTPTAAAEDGRPDRAGGRRALEFLLAPDANAARRARRALVERHGALTGVVVGVWSELRDRARDAWLLPRAGDDGFADALAEAEGAFWSESLSVAQSETAGAVRSALTAVVSAADPAGEIAAKGIEDLPERPRRHLEDLFRLAHSLGDGLPQPLRTLRALLDADAREALHPVRVFLIEDMPRLSRWQRALVDKLNRDADLLDGGARRDFTPLLREALDEEPAAAPDTALGSLQRRLFREPPDEKTALDGSVQWVGVRDFMQEAEVAAGMAQSMLADDPSLKPADIGLLVPDSFEYAAALEAAFRLGGIALSGLPAERWRRDLGREAVFHFLYCRNRPAPAMALAACLTSPLMPWARGDGAELAQRIMRGDYGLKTPGHFGREAKAMLRLLRKGDSEPAALARALKRFGSLLDGGEPLAQHVLRGRQAAGDAAALLEGAAEIPWRELRAAASPRFMDSGETPDFNLEGATVWRESQEPWRPVRRLIVTGFAQGRYPGVLGGDPVFPAADFQAILERTDLRPVTPAQRLAQRRDRFRRQLGAAAESATFLVPRRDPKGDPQRPSESLVFMHPLLDGPGAAEDRILELDAPESRAAVRHLALAAEGAARPPRLPASEDLALGRDLLTLRAGDDGKPKPESPSGLETLMVSGLGWLLRRMHAEPLGWAPESADAALLGSLAHQVFEGLFAPGAPLPDREGIRARVETLTDEAVRRRAPFLRGTRWQVERRHFVAETARAAREWREVLAQLKAEVVACEAWLRGAWAGIAVTGQCDLIMRLPNGRLVLVDHKRSGSSKRRERMEKGYESQVSLYRAMLQSGGLENREGDTLVEPGGGPPGIAYFMLNDQIVLSDMPLPAGTASTAWQTLGNDVAGEAMALIRRRLDGIRAGRVRLNRTEDRGMFEKEAGLSPFALEISPLIGLFTRHEPEDEDGAPDSGGTALERPA